MFLSAEIHASDAVIEASQPIGTTASPSRENARKEGVASGGLCTDSKGSAYSRGAVIAQNQRYYRCVKVYGENFSENQRLAWVEVSLKNGVAETLD